MFGFQWKKVEMIDFAVQKKGNKRKRLRVNEKPKRLKELEKQREQRDLGFTHFKIWKGKTSENQPKD
jgi:hypothetical protein